MNYSTLLRCGAILAGCALAAFGQAFTETSDSGPLSPSLALATPTASYTLTGLDRVNYYNGAVSALIPLLTIGGRGRAAVSLAVPINRQWTVQQISTNGSVSTIPVTSQSALVGINYTPGVLVQSASSASPDSCIVTDQFGAHWAGLGPYLTWLVWRASDGSASVLVDSTFNGQAQGASITSCSQVPTYQPANRGRVFTSYDGSNIVFVAAQDVTDSTMPGETALSGTLYFPDGSHYVISSGQVTAVVDRNGNRITYAFQSTPTGGIYTISDSAGRTETVNFTEDPVSTPQDVITYPGAVGRITVNYIQLQAALSLGESLKTYACLFPELNGSTLTQFNPWVVSSIVLPDNSSYTFQYNSYGDLARLKLPTGGVYTYRYQEASGCTDTTGTSGVIPVFQAAHFSIYRRLLERDELSDGVNISAKMVFSALPVPASTGLPIDPNHPARSGTKVQVDFEDPSNSVLRREVHFFYGNPSAADSLPASDTKFPNWTDGIEFQTQIGPPGTILQLQQKVWTQRPCSTSELCWFDPLADGARPHDSRTCEVNTQLDSALPSQASAVVFGYDQFNNVTDTYEFNYGSAPAVAAACPAVPIATGFSRRTAMLYKTDAAYVAANVNLTHLPISRTVYDGFNIQVANETWAYDSGALQNAPGLAGHDDGAYGLTNTVRGNVTSHQVWQNTTGTSPSESSSYDTTGSLVGRFDFNGNPTTFFYSDGAHVSPTAVTNALGRKQQYMYDPGTLKVTQSVDENNVTSKYFYNDPLDRLTAVQGAVATSAESWTKRSYPSPTTVTVNQDQSIKQDGVLRTDSFFDGLGRPTEARQYESALQFISTTTSYDSLGRVHTSTNPSRPGDGLNFPTVYGYDAVGRILSSQTSDGATTSISYSFNAAALLCQTDTTDPAGSTVRRLTDAFGRLKQLVEDPAGLNNNTSYSYDALDNLTSVAQNGQTRTFNYDSRGRLTSTTTPEGGTISYPLYDSNGNLKQQTWGPVTTINSYDGLDRLTSTTYVGVATPAVTYCYDGQVAGPADGSCVPGTVANAVGRLTQVRTSVSMTSYTGYDPFGRITSSEQTTSGTPYSFQYGYDLSGSLTQETYPSGRTVMNGYDGAGRLCSAGSTTATPAPAPPYACSGAGSTVYAKSIQYAPQGAVKSFLRGDQLTETWTYNSRMQPASITAGTVYGLSLYYCGSKAASCPSNNGNLLVATPTTPGVDQVAFYDKVNRLTAFVEGTNSQSYSYDPPGFGSTNRWVSANSGLPLSSFMPTTSNGYNAQNRLAGAQYADGRGNVTTLGASVFGYDGENRLVSTQVGANGGTYGYDGSGQRVMKTVGQQTTTYVYDAMGNLAAEYGVSSSPCSTCYVSVDQLRSTRVLTDVQGNVKERHDYMPFGDELPTGVGGRATAQGYLGPASTPSVSVLFTGQYRDTELASSGMPSGLDYFGARHNAPGLGRFMQVDQPLNDQYPSDAQSWNLYGYARNNPLVNVDPTGRCSQAADGGYTDEGSGLFAGPCADGQIGGTTAQQVNVNSQQGNIFQAIGWNFFFGLDNAANAFFSPLTRAIGVTPSYMRETPTGAGWAANVGAGLAIAATALVGPEGESGQVAQIGRKLDYLLGLAKGSAHSVIRSQSMASALNKIGLSDSPAIRQYLAEHLNQVLNDATNIVSRQGGTEVRESLLMGPGGGVKLQSVWQGDKLITFFVKGGH